MPALKTPLLLFLISVVLNGCGLLDSDSGKSMWAEENLNDFVIYAYSPSGDSFAVIDLKTGEILRQMNDFKGLQSVVSNEDGSLLYISTGTGPGGASPGFIYKVDTSTWKYEIIYNHAAHLLENRNEGIFFITKEVDSSTGDAVSDRMFGEINPATGQVTEMDSIDVVWTAWYDDRLIEIHPFQPVVYAVDDWPGRLYRYNYVTKKREYLFQNLSFGSLGRITLSGDGNMMYIPGGPVLDLSSEDMQGSIPVWRLGSATARKDDKEVYLTDPGGYLREPYSQEQVFVYNPEGDSIADSIHVGSMTDQIYLTPKERYAVVNDWMFSYFVIDLKERKVIKKQQYIENNVATLSVQGMYLAPKPPSLQ